MINTPGTNLNVAPIESVMNNSFSQSNEIRRMTENSNENIDNTKLSSSAIPSADQMQSGNFYSQNQQAGQQESHLPSSNGYPSTGVPVSAQSYKMQYNPHDQSVMYLVILLCLIICCRYV